MTEHAGPRTPTASSRELALATTFVRLADSLVADDDVIDVLDVLVHTCVTLLDVNAAGMLLRDTSGGLIVAASSDEDARMLEVFQAQNDQGPCLDCVHQGQQVHSSDLQHARDRWPKFVPIALRAGFRNVSAVPLRLRGETVGALGLFGKEAAELPAQDRDLAQAFADVATVGLLQSRSVHRSALMAEQLRSALDSRIVIEQAKGVLVERNGWPMERAFERLRKHARDNNLKLTHVALSVVQGELRLPPS